MILSKFYEAIVQRFKDTGLAIEYFDIWNDQIMRNEDQDDALFFNYPAIFIEYEPIQWESLGNRKQQALLYFNLYICSEQPHETANIETQDERNRGFEHLQLLDDTFNVLHGFRKGFDDGSGFGTISRTGTTYEHNNGDLIIAHTMPFKCLITDVVGVKQLQPKNPKLDITSGIKATGRRL